MTGIVECGYCGCFHTGTCPKVKAIEYFPNGMVKRVEFHNEADNRQTIVVPIPAYSSEPTP